MKKTAKVTLLLGFAMIVTACTSGGPTWQNPDATASTSETPVLMRAVAPRYPRSARAQKLEGYVVMSLDISAEGKVTNVSVTDSSPENLFDQAAMESVKKSKWRPAERDGTAIPFENLEHRIDFNLFDNS